MSLNKFTIQKSFAISAGAGSGKTYTLSRRYINALLGFDYFREDYAVQESFVDELKPARVNEVATITYTEAAALEMRGRIFELVSKVIEFESLNADDGDYKSIKEANEHLTQEQRTYVTDVLSQAYTQSSNTKISTIHSFCLDIIKRNADVARIDTKLDIIKEDEKQKELSDIIFNVFNDPKNEQSVLEISKNISLFFLNGLISKYVSNSKFRKHYDSFDKQSVDSELYKKLIHELYPLPDDRDAMDELPDDPQRLEWLENYCKNFAAFEAVAWNRVNPEAKTPSLGEKKFPAATLLKSQMEGLVSYYSLVDESKEELFFEKIEKIKTLLHEIKNGYDARLKELSKTDFDSIITKTLEIMPEVKTSFKYIMVDEFQDTNEMQFEIIKAAMNEDTNLFVVGDSKQAIYSFQGAEIEVFNNAVEDRSLFCSIEDMSKNHRSDGVVLKNVNDIFETLLAQQSSSQLISQNYEAHPQALEVFKKERAQKGSFKFLMTPVSYGGEENELDTIATLVSQIVSGKIEEYQHISKKIDTKEKAIAIIFDSSTKMLALKQKLRELGINAKVSTTDNFYHTKEINDLFHTLKAIDILSKNKTQLSDSQKFFVVAAMRSNILKIDENSIKKHLDAQTLPQKLEEHIEQFGVLPLSEFVKYLYDGANIVGVYAHFDDVEQRIANLYKFLDMCLEFQASGESNIYSFLSLMESAIYHSEAKEEEAFYKSENAKSIEICSIHSTKGLAYPLVLLGNSEKGLFSQITSDSLKHNNFTINAENKEIVGFKINGYEPLCFRVLKQLDKLKHLAEKKRLLYVALTRAEHDVIISGALKAKKDGGITLREDSYLAIMIDALNLDKESLYTETSEYSLKIERGDGLCEDKKRNISYVEHSFAPLAFTQKIKIASATQESQEYDEKAAHLGTITHKIFELYWDKLQTQEHENIFFKFGIEEKEDQEKIKSSIEKFLKSDLYSELKSGAKHSFELEFQTQERRDFIDLVYYNEQKEGWVIVDFKTGNPSKEKEEKYQQQLEFYEDVLKNIGMSVVDKQLCWV